MPATLPEQLLHQLVVGDAAAIAAIVEASRTSDDPMILVAAALFASDGDGLIARAGGMAATTRDRQLVAIATAHLRGERDLVDALARDHLVDHPDNVLVAWIAGASHARPARPDLKQGAVMNRKLTAVLLILAAVLANVGFTALGSIFNYPDVLDEPAGEVLAAFRDSPGRGQRLVLVLAFSAALLAPIAIGVGRLSAQRRCASRCRSGSPPPSCRSSACCAGRSSSPATRPTRPAATPASRLGPRLVHHRERHPRHGHRRDARVPPHRDVDGARRRRARSSLRRALVPGAGRGVGGARVRRRVLAARRCR